MILPMAKAMYGENHLKTHELQSEMNLLASRALGDPALSEEEELAAAQSLFKVRRSAADGHSQRACCIVSAARCPRTSARSCRM